MAVIQPVLAFTQMTSPFITTDSTIFVEPHELADLIVIEFNQQACAESHMASLQISAPLFSNSLQLGPTLFDNGSVDATATGIKSSNVLPFGPVNLAFPSISQTANDRIACERTYFFVDEISA
jgi:hypothetical protein